MRAIFFGTPAWAVPSLEAILDSGIEVSVVVTNPDRPAGRRGELRAPPVKEAAAARGVAVAQPASARGPEMADLVSSLAPDVVAVVAYGRILPGELLAIPPLGFVNLHFSLLPKYRGAAPVQRALLAGERVTGISTIVLTEGMDEGPVLARQEVAIDPTESAGELGLRLAVLGAPLLVKSLTGYAGGQIVPQEQDHQAATYAPKLSTSDARIDWTRPAGEVVDLVRGANPEPGAWTTLDQSRVKILRAAVGGEADLEPGRLAIQESGLMVGAGDQAVAILEAQRAGGKSLGGVEFARGLRVTPDASFY